MRHIAICGLTDSRLRLKCDGTRAKKKNRFRLSAKRTSPFKSAGGVSWVDYWAAEVCASAVVMLDTACSEVVWRVLATQYIGQFLLHFLSRVSPCAIIFQLDCTTCTAYLNIYNISSFWNTLYISLTSVCVCVCVCVCVNRSCLWYFSSISFQT